MPSFVRYSHDGIESYGLIDGESVRALTGDLFGEHDVTGRGLTSR